MQKAVELSIENVAKGGGPFGALVAKGGQIIATGVNKVVTSNDPTAHAEIVAIRKAAKKLKTFDLTGCSIYTSCEPCPMCLSAIYWAKISVVYYSSSKKDASKAGFRDSVIYKEISLPPSKRKLPMLKIKNPEALVAFKLWLEKEDKIKY
jgi:tRNA(Arg) A34 adenosine deaminase TadA